MSDTTTSDVLQTPCPTPRITVSLPLATIEQLDQLATTGRVNRQQLVCQIINASLLSETPHWPTGPDPLGRHTERAYVTHCRSLELAQAHAEKA